MIDKVIPIINDRDLPPSVYGSETPAEEKKTKKSVAEKKNEKRIMRLAGKAIAEFGMIEGGDKVMVCISGGKDSYVLLDVLMKLQKRAPVPFELLALNVDQHLPNFPKDVIPNYLEKIGVPYHIEDQDTWRKFIYQLTPEDLPNATAESFECPAVGDLSPSFGVGDGCDSIGGKLPFTV